MHEYPIRKRPRLPRCVYRDGHVFFVTMVTADRFRWFTEYPALCESLVDIVTTTARERHAELYAWCIMPEHLHLLVQDDDLVDFVRLVKGRATPIARRIKRERRLWQKSFWDHGLRKEESVYSVAAYIWENPIRREIVEDAVDYRWSGSLVWPDWREHYRSA